MKKLVVLLTALLLTLASAPAQTVRRATAVSQDGQGVPSSLSAAFRSGEVFELRMSGMPPEDAAPFAQTFTIGGDGYVNIPFAGQVRAVGLTQSQLERAIEKRLVEEQIFTHPTATINVAQGARYVTIGGQVRSPQRMVWSPDLTLLSGISAAGGAAEFAGDKIKLSRSRKVSMFSRKRLNKFPEEDPKLLPGDQVDQL